MARGQGFSVIVGSGSVAPSVFVHYLTGTAASGDVIAGYAVQQSFASAITCGISQEGTRYAPTDENVASAQAGSYTGTAGYTGDPIKVYGIGDICLLSIATTVTPGQLLTPNANGQGVLWVTGQGTYVGAQAIEGGVSGALIRVQVKGL